jgi:hypothetical protein
MNAAFGPPFLFALVNRGRDATQANLKGDRFVAQKQPAQATISISPAALPRSKRRCRTDRRLRLAWTVAIFTLPRSVLDRLKAMRGAGESYRAVILRLADAESPDAVR